MSGIYGYHIRESVTSDSYKEVMRYWNLVYGKNCMEDRLSVKSSSTAEGFLGVCLEHLSGKVPEQREMLTRDQRSAVMDVLLYNREELIQRYIPGEGEHLSDEELLFVLIQQEGFTVLAEVNGDFAGAVWNGQDRTITLFRDHLGIRPLYYFYSEDGLFFSTDIRGLLALPGYEFHINESMFFRNMMGYSTNTPDETDFREIGLVRAASYQTFRLDGTMASSRKEYWHLGSHKIHLESNEAYEHRLRELIEHALQVRMDAVDGRIGAELSGGLDSSVLSILVHRLGREGRYHSWSRDPKEQPILRADDERQLILDICEQEGFICKFIDKDTPFPNAFETMMDNCFPPGFNTVDITRVSSWFQTQGVHGVVTGHGGDEGVSHRGCIYELWYQKEYASFVKHIYDSTKGRKLRLLRTVKRACREIQVGKRRRKPFRGINHMELGLNPEFLQRMDATVKPAPVTFHCDVPAYIRSGGQQSRMKNTATQGAPFQVRYLYPYLDYQVIDYAVSIPRSQFHNGSMSRWVYKRAFADIMPDSLTRLHSKNMPSEQKKVQGIPKEAIQSMNEDRQNLLDRLDREFWAPYLDFEALDNWKLPENATESEYSNYHFAGGNIVYCISIQNVLNLKK